MAKKRGKIEWSGGEGEEEEDEEEGEKKKKKEEEKVGSRIRRRLSEN